jgi:hypothetical protein
MTWKNIQDELPPIGKKILVANLPYQEQDGRLRVMTLKYSFEDDASENRYYGNATTEQLQQHPMLWMLIPELPEDKNE